jgi:SAM-dependent methyltransferase
VSRGALPAAVRAFDHVASTFDERFGAWRSVEAQRAAVRHVLADTFPEGSRLLELGGGTGDDALWLVERGRSVHLTDGAPRMVEAARRKAEVRARGADLTFERLLAEEVEPWSGRRPAGAFDGAYSNFAALNCVEELRPVARGLARLIVPEGAAVLVLFGPLPPGEIVAEMLRGRPAQAFRRLGKRAVEASLAGERFTVRYPGPRTLARDFRPWFRIEGMHGIGIFVPPSAAEPAISRHPRLVRALAALDRAAARPCALLGDHVAYVLRRTGAASPAGPGTREGV